MSTEPQHTGAAKPGNSNTPPCVLKYNKHACTLPRRLAPVLDVAGRSAPISLLVGSATIWYSLFKT